MVPPVDGRNFPTLDIRVTLVLLGLSVIAMFIMGTRTFLRRVIT